MPVGEILCPHCRRPTIWVDNENRPFCSERCRLIDLGAWFESSYRIPEATIPSTDDSEENQR